MVTYESDLNHIFNMWNINMFTTHQVRRFKMVFEDSISRPTHYPGRPGMVVTLFTLLMFSEI